MGSTTIRLDEDVYERLRAVKRDDESFSEAVDRLLSGGSLLDLVGLWSAGALAEVRDTLDDVDVDGIDEIDEVVAAVERE